MQCDAVFHGNVQSEGWSVVGGAKEGGAVFGPRQGASSAREVTPQQPVQENRSLLRSWWGFGRDKTFIVEPRTTDRFRALCGNEKFLFYAGSHNGNMLMAASLEEADNVIELQNFGNDRIRIVDGNNRIVAACNKTNLAVFGCAATFPRLFQIHVASLASVDSKFADVRVCPEKFGKRSEREVLVLLSSGEVFSINFLENRFAKLFDAQSSALQIGYLSHSRNICVVGRESISILDLTHALNDERRKREIAFGGRPIESVAFHPFFSWMVAVGLPGDLLLCDLRFDRPLLGRRSAFDVEMLSFSVDGMTILSGSKSGLIARHELEIIENGHAIVWKGRECLVESAIRLMRSYAVILTGLCSSPENRAFTLCSVGHLFESSFVHEDNVEIVGTLSHLFLGNHDELEVMQVAKWRNNDFENVDDDEIQVDIDEVCNMLLRVEEPPKVPDVDMLLKLDNVWKANSGRN